MGSKKITGSSQLIDCWIIANASAGSPQATTRRPAVCVNSASGDSLWCSTAPMPPPHGILITTGRLSWPSDRYRILASWVVIWSKAGNTKPSNWISHTGR